jgi:hypothetical protein
MEEDAGRLEERTDHDRTVAGTVWRPLP